MDSVQKIWMYHQWLGDQRDNADIARNHAYLLGSFSNPEAVKKMMGDNVHESSDEDFEATSKLVKDFSTQALQQVKKRKRKIIENKVNNG
jgi:hypothetical protein